HFPEKSVSQVRRILRDLYEQGYLKRLERPLELPTVHVIGPNGIRYFIGARGLTFSQVKRRYDDHRLSPAILPHNLELVHLYALAKAASLRPAVPIAELGCYVNDPHTKTRHLVTGVEIATWHTEQQLYLRTTAKGKQAERVPDPLDPSNTLTVLPDLHIRLRLSLGQATTLRAYVVERERSRRSLARFMEKVHALYAWNDPEHNRYAARFGEPSFYRVLIIPDTWRECLIFGKLIAEGKWSPRRFWFCPYAEFTPENVFGKIWLRAADMPKITPTMRDGEVLQLVTDPEIAERRLSLLDDGPLRDP
ncbi:MAG: replication-relaxation family protein, partial [Deinococcus sp.]|nr:replication-relaxation family protein [Deinococcus sp.]